MMKHPSRIWICAVGSAQPEWVVERMATGDVASDGSFEIETPDGPVKVERGFAVFELNGEVYACPPKLVQEKLRAAAGEEEPAPAASPRPETDAVAPAKVEAPLKLKRAIGSPPSPQFAAIDDLLVDDSYQRSIEGGASRTLIRKIAENWDWRLCLPLLVSRRDGKLYVIDGQHRREAAALRGDIQHMPVVVFDLDGPQTEAELFVMANRSRRAMSRLDDFHAAVVAGDPKVVAVNQVVAAAGLAVGRTQAWQYWKPGEVVFVVAIQKALGSVGRPVVEQALGIIARAFSGLVLTGAGLIFEGLCTVIRERAKAGGPIDPTLMERVLAEVGIPGWKEATANAESGPDRMDMMLRALTTAYEEAEVE